MPLRAPPFVVRDRARRRRGDDAGVARRAALRRRADQHRRARSRGDAAAGSSRSSPPRRDPPHAARRQHRRHAGARARDRDAARRASARRRCGCPLPAPRSQGVGSATSSRPPRPTAPCASTSRRATRDRFVSAVDVLDGRVDPAQLQRKLVLIGVTGLGLRRVPEHAARRAHAGQRDPRAAAGEPVRRHAAAPARLGAARSKALVFLLLGALLVVGDAALEAARRRAARAGCASRCSRAALARVPLAAAAVRRGDARRSACCCCSACCWC